MLREEVDMVGDNHQVANLKMRVHTASCIRNKQRLDAQFVHDADREGYLLHGIALIEMEASLHRHDVDTSQLAEYQFATMSLHGRYGKVGNFCIWDFNLVSYFGS